MDGQSPSQLRIRLDAHTLSRLEALRLLLNESGCAFHRDQILKEALLLGLDVMLGETLEKEGLQHTTVQRTPRGAVLTH